MMLPSYPYTGWSENPVKPHFYKIVLPFIPFHDPSLFLTRIFH